MSGTELMPLSVAVGLSGLPAEQADETVDDGC